MKRRRFTTVAVLAGLALSGCGRGAAQGDGQERAAQFLDTIRAGQIDPAWQMTSAEFRSLMGMENLRDFAKTHPALLQPAEHSAAAEVERAGSSMVEHTFQTKPAGRVNAATIRVLVSPGKDGWVVEHLAAE